MLEYTNIIYYTFVTEQGEIYSYSFPFKVIGHIIFCVGGWGFVAPPPRFQFLGSQ